VRLVLEQGLSVHRAAADLGIKDTTLRGWIEKARLGILDPQSPKSQELEEVKRLRRENAVLKQEREILKKATAFFAKMSH
jgi:transposase